MEANSVTDDYVYYWCTRLTPMCSLDELNHNLLAMRTGIITCISVKLIDSLIM